MANRRKTLVVNKKFQYQQTLLIVAITVLVSNLFLLGSTLLPDVPAIEITSGAALVIGLIELALIGAVWYGSIWASNKVAGPVYVFSRQIRLFSEGDLNARISLRKHDFFLEEAGQINESLDKLQRKLEAISSAAHEIRDARGDEGPRSGQLEDLLKQLAVFEKAES